MDNILQGDGTKILYDILLMIADGDNEARGCAHPQRKYSIFHRVT